MKNISQVWEEQFEYYKEKSLSQIIGIIHDGSLKDGNLTSKQFRDWLNNVDSVSLARFINDCLSDKKFENSGLALQDIVNQIGSRLEFEIEYGLYQGLRNSIGFDGIWKSKDGYSLIVEVKTTDAYRISLDTISTYRKKLAAEGIIEIEKSSILIVVGRQDTGDLEAQIRGSKHAWDIRLISTESLLQLLKLKENFNDLKTINQIKELLKPKEYTRIDSLIQMITSTTEDLTEELEIAETDLIPEVVPQIRVPKEQQIKPASFHEECLIKIRAKLKLSLVKRSRVTYSDGNNTVGLTCAVSKEYNFPEYQQYWFAFQPNQGDFLKSFDLAYVGFGCGTADKILLIPFKEFSANLEYLNITNLSNRYYYHIHINFRDNKTYLILHKRMGNKDWDVTQYLI